MYGEGPNERQINNERSAAFQEKLKSLEGASLLQIRLEDNDLEFIFQDPKTGMTTTLKPCLDFEKYQRDFDLVDIVDDFQTRKDNPDLFKEDSGNQMNNPDIL